MTDQRNRKSDEDDTCAQSVRTCAKSARQKIRSLWIEYVTAPLHHWFRRTGRTALAFIGAGVVVIAIIGIIVPALNGAVWKWLVWAWGQWTNPLDAIVTGVLTGIVAVVTARITVRPAQIAANFSAIETIENIYNRIQGAKKLLKLFKTNVNRTIDHINDLPFVEDNIESINKNISEIAIISTDIENIYNFFDLSENAYSIFTIARLEFEREFGKIDEFSIPNNGHYDADFEFGKAESELKRCVDVIDRNIQFLDDYAKNAAKNMRLIMGTKYFE